MPGLASGAAAALTRWELPHTVPPVIDSKPALRLAGLGLLALLGLAIFAGVSYVSARRWVDHTLEVLKENDEWRAALLDTQARARGYAFSEDASFLGSFEASLARERVTAKRLRELVRDNPAQGENVELADQSARAAMQASRDLVAAIREGRRNDARALFAVQVGKQHARAFTEAWRTIQVEEERLLAARRSRAQERAIAAAAGALALGLFSLAILLFAWKIQTTRALLLNRLARDARQRLQDLSDLAAALANSRSRDDVAQQVIERGMQIAGSDTCTLYLLDEEGTALDLIAERGIAKGLLDRVRRLTGESLHAPSLSSLRTGEAVWVEGPEEYAQLFPELAQAKVEGQRARAFWSVPLIVEGKPVGLLGMGYYQPRAFLPDDRGMAQTMAQQCAQALLRAERHEREDEARRWFTTTLRSIGDAVIATDDEGRITFMNQVAEKLTGFLESEARGQPLDQVFRIFSERTGEVVESPVAKVLRKGTVVGLANHTVLRRKDGRDLPIDDSGAPIRNQEGRLFGVVLVFRDVSRQKTEEARRDFLGRAGQVLVQSLDFEVTLGTIAHLAVPTLADWCAVDIVDRDTSELRLAAVAHVDPRKLELARDMRKRYPPSPDQPGGAHGVVRSGNSVLHAEISREMLLQSARDEHHLELITQLGLRSAIIVPLKAQGRCVGAMTFVHAESERRFDGDDLAFAEDFAQRASMAIENSLALKEVQEARSLEQRLRSEAEIANRAKDEFLAMVSHELRTPLNAILGWTMILRTRNPASEIDEGLVVIERNAHAQTKLIEDVLDVSRIIGGKLTLNPESIDFVELVEAAVKDVTPTARAKQILIEVEGMQRPIQLIADAHRVRQVVSNLLSNAVKFTPEGGRILVRLEETKGEALLHIEDNGEGIAADSLPYIFDAFHQADASTTRHHGGLGLGLAIVKQIVTAHGGSVDAHSEGPGAGSRFTVRFPKNVVVAAVQRTASTPPPSLLSKAPRLDGVRVLVVDDEADARSLLREALSEQGAEISSAASAGQAFLEVQRFQPHVIVSDIGMPGEDGYSLMRRIRELSPSEGATTPAIALTAYARGIDVERAQEAGYQLHLTKPVDPARLLAAVAQLSDDAPPV